MMEQIKCDHCQTLNPASGSECTACGAPLELIKPESETFIEPISIMPLEIPEDHSTEQVQNILNKASAAYGLVWRTLGEALAIAMSASMLGFIGAVTNMAIWAILGAILVGIIVGLVKKNFWLTLFGAPVGTLLGILLWTIFWFAGAGAAGMVITASVLAMVGALFGRITGGVRSGWWQRLRPLIGAMGALLFVLIGIAIGESLQWFFVNLSN